MVWVISNNIFFFKKKPNFGIVGLGLECLKGQPPNNKKNKIINKIKIKKEKEKEKEDT